MIWELEKFLEMEIVSPGSVFGLYDVVCENCNCDYTATEESLDDGRSSCPNCGSDNPAHPYEKKAGGEGPQ